MLQKKEALICSITLAERRKNGYSTHCAKTSFFVQFGFQETQIFFCHSAVKFFNVWMEMFWRYFKWNFPIPHLNRYVNEVLRKTSRLHSRQKLLKFLHTSNLCAYFLSNVLVSIMDLKNLNSLKIEIWPKCMSYFSKFFAQCVTGARNLLFLLDNSFFLDVHEQKIADHCGYPQQSQTRSNVENCVLQIEFPSLALHIDDKLDSVHFVERSTMFLVIFGMPKVPSKIV